MILLFENNINDISNLNNIYIFGKIYYHLNILLFSKLNKLFFIFTLL